MVAYQLGEAEAFEVLYARHSPKVYGYLKKRTANEALAKDIFQSTFLKLHKNRSKYDPTFPFLPWLFTVCRSELLDAMKIAHKKHEILSDQLPERAAHEDHLRDQDAQDISLETLPATQRMALELRFQNDFSFEEIAARLETSPMNARQIVSRGIRALRGVYGKR